MTSQTTSNSPNRTFGHRRPTRSCISASGRQLAQQSLCQTDLLVLASGLKPNTEACKRARTLRIWAMARMTVTNIFQVQPPKSRTFRQINARSGSGSSSSSPFGHARCLTQNNPSLRLGHTAGDAESGSRPCLLFVTCSELRVPWCPPEAPISFHVWCSPPKLGRRQFWVLVTADQASLPALLCLLTTSVQALLVHLNGVC